MTHKTALAVILAGCTLAATSAASAQTTSNAAKGFLAARMKVSVDVNVGAQTQAQTLNTSTSFPLYNETAVVNGAEAVDGGPIFDISGRYDVMKHVSAGVGFSVFSRKGDGTLVASIPDPNVLNKPANSSTSATDLKHREQAVHLMVAYTLAVMPKVDAVISAGPSFFTLKQDILSASVAAGTQTAKVATLSEKASKVGANIGVNLNYMVTPNYGGGAFVRYAGTTATLPSAGSVKVGGVQLGIGARLRF